MRSALVIGAKDLRQRLRDRSAYVIGFVAPIGLAVIISLAFGGGFQESFRATYALADLDGGQLSRAFATDVLGGEQLGDQVTVVEASADEAVEMVGRGEVAAAFVIPEGFEERLADGEAVEMRVVRGQGAEVGGLVAEAVARTFTDSLEAGRLSVLTALQTGRVDLERIPELAAEAATAEAPIALEDTGVGERAVSAVNYFGPSMAIFFLYFTVGFAARSLYAEREAGTMGRLLASPVSAAGILGGKALSVVVYGLASLGVMFGTMTLAFGVSWGDPLAVVALSVATVLAILGVTALVGAVARTGQQADNGGQLVAFGFALLGGSFFPLFQLSETLQRVALATPNGWAIRGFTDLVYDGGGLASVAPNLLALSLFALVSGGLALAFGRRVVRA